MATSRDREEILKNADIASIGSHCDIDTCKQLDFLPFVCESCKGTFCLDHRTETAHSCKKAGSWLSSLRLKPAQSIPAAPKTRGLLAAPCAAEKCKTTVNTPTQPGVNCVICRKQYCLAHRLQDSHDCKPLPAPAASVAQEKAKEALSKFRAWGSQKGAETTTTGSGIFAGLRKKPANTSVAAVLKMKKEAKGDEKVPQEKRVYLFVEAEARTTSAKIPKGTFWYSKDWSVGRVLDVAAKSLQVTNLNNQGDSEEKRLRIYHVEGGRVLTFGEKIGDTTINGNTLVLLRGLHMPDMLVE
ncbi:hypothetical protein BZA05DRAFT_393740 [Tricharina praecox]|uniref:uncharacterized protein n=1 Tax=Tricharina praecox TaxID=43433 RepID=UPI00221F5599|nr:uncharacterized protein BZA05DRAFT_393740 [Tricharina praecox]KAI5854281.1 hypothetical protein BZA05DRAFT_393740 [Tricharina praecox]